MLRWTGQLRIDLNACLAQKFIPFIRKFFTQRILAGSAFHYLPTGLEQVNFLALPGPRISLSVVEQKIDFQPVMTHPPYSLEDFQRIAMRVTQAVEPCYIVHTDRFDDECVSVPLSNRVSPERRRGAFGVFASIQVNRPYLAPL